MSGLKSRRKGYMGEYNLRKYLQKAGFRTVWHNEDVNRPDMTAYGVTNSQSLSIECKYTATVPKFVYKALSQDEDSNCVIMKRVDGKKKHKWLITMELNHFLEHHMDKKKGK